ncbi:MAG: hypothetical protein VB130_05065, partial [Clostridium sp.]|nr:hypothetical protein [Clostridium sp.]
MSALLLGWFFSIFGILIFIAKYGGFYYKVNNILFLNDSVRYLLLISPFSINTISRMISIGRSIFIFSLTGFCINLCKKSLKFSSVFYILSALFSILNIIFYDPKVYKMFINTLAKETIFSISIITRLWLICSFIFSTIIMIKKYRKTSIPWIKKNLKYIYSGLYSLIIFYFYLGFMGPLQVTDIRTYYFLYSDFSNFNPPLTLIEWYSYILITIVTSILSTVYLWKYTNIESKLGKSYMQLSRKLKTADMGVKVFTHGIKNQLIMLQLLVNQTIDLYNKNNNISEEDDKIKVNLYKSQEILNHTMNRMDDLYKSFKNSNLQLRPFSANKIIESTIDKIKIIPENVNFQYKLLDED